MASDNTVVPAGKRLTSANSTFNAISFLMQQTIADKVNTAAIVRIDEADNTSSSSAAGSASATPLVCQTDGEGNAIPATQIPRIRVFRYQTGKAAFVFTGGAQPGDHGVVVFTKTDSSGVTTGNNEPSRPATHRSFDMADGIAFPSVDGEAPETWVELDPVSGEISVSTKAANIGISCRESGDINVTTNQGNVMIQAGNNGQGDITLDGRVLVTRTIQILNKNNEPGGSQMRGGFTNIGGTITTNNITVETHTHSGIDRGSSNTDAPVVGT